MTVTRSHDLERRNERAAHAGRVKMSPTTPTCRLSKEPFSSQMEVRIEQRLGGMLVLPSPASMTDTPDIRDLAGTPAQRSRTTMQSIL